MFVPVCHSGPLGESDTCTPKQPHGCLQLPHAHSLPQGTPGASPFFTEELSPSSACLRVPAKCKRWWRAPLLQQALNK